MLIDLDYIALEINQRQKALLIIELARLVIIVLPFCDPTVNVSKVMITNIITFFDKSLSLC